jgi:hypothetical protein
MSTSTESSVTFNLRDLLRLERERVEEAERTARVQARAEADVQAEASARLARQEADERERQREHAEAVAHIQREAANEAHVRATLRREATLQQVRAEVDAWERTEHARLRLEHERKLQELGLSLEASRGARGLRSPMWLSALAMAAMAVLAHTTLIAPAQDAAERAHAQARSAERQAARAANELVHLRSHLASTPEPKASTQPKGAEIETPRTYPELKHSVAPPKGTTGRAGLSSDTTSANRRDAKTKTQGSGEDTALSDLDAIEDGDPLLGLADPNSSRDARPRRRTDEAQEARKRR